MSGVIFPRSLEELFARQERHPDAFLMAGGTDLLVRLRSFLPEQEKPFICLERIHELSEVRELPDGGIVIGGCVSFSRIAAHPLLRKRCPVLTRAAASAGGPAIRNMATIGGNIATASPAGDSLPPLYVLGAVLELVSAGGVRRLPVAEYITGPGMSSGGPGEVISKILIPSPDRFNLQHFEKVGRRKSLAIAVASLAAAIRLENDRVAEARFAWGSVGPTVVCCPEAEAALVGRPLTEESLIVAAGHARETVRPIDDIRATAAYRRAVAGNLLLRLAV